MTTELPLSLHLIASKQLGGADQFYLRLVQALAAAGQPVCAGSRAGSPIATELDSYLACAAQRGESAPFGHYSLPFVNQWDALSLWRIRDLVQRLRPAIVQTYLGRATRLTRLPQRRGKKTAIHITRLGGYYKLDGYYRHADAWIGNTRGVCDYLIRCGLPAHKVFMIGNFVPEPEPELNPGAATALLRRQFSLPDEALLIFTLGRFISIKGFNDLLQAFAALPAHLAGRPLHLLVAGDGPERNALQHQTIALKLTERVHWLGWQRRPGRLFRLADIVVCPSRYETLGNVILEAWSYAKPVVATASAGAQELIDDDSNGLLCPCASPIDLAERLRQALTAAAPEQKRLGQAGYDTLQRQHSSAAVLRQYTELYSQLSHAAR